MNSIFWFRQDLRLSDNPGLVAAAKNGDVLPIYILQNDEAGKDAMGAASKVWLHHALTSLNESLDGKLIVEAGNAQEVLDKYISAHDIQAVFWNRCYEPWRIKVDKKIKADLRVRDIICESFNGSLLWEPWVPLKSDGTPYKVFTPFYKKGCLGSEAPRQPVRKPQLQLIEAKQHKDKIDALELLPNKDWTQFDLSDWDISEQGALKQLKWFLKNGLGNYKQGRDFPALKTVSKLSPYLHFGQLSPNQAWWAVKDCADSTDAQHFCSELGWREFSYSLLYHNPKLRTKNFNEKYDNFPWRKSAKLYNAWCKGQTGVPMVDAGMRELWQTGYMHNRVRMIVGSFLIKNLLIDWREGEKWFWDCLLDADHASNAASWQWVAGSGADAAPYFRIFNPVTQGEKFDPDGEYIKQFVPELKNLPTKYLFAPWDAPADVLKKAGVILGEIYPLPIVDLKESRSQALAAYSQIKS